MAEDGFKLPMSSYDDLTRIIIAYGHQQGPAKNDEIANLAGTSKSTVSRNNGFLLAVGIVEGGNLKQPTSRGQQLARALDFETESAIQREWRSLILESDFLKKIITSVKIRKGMERPSLKTHIAYTAGERKTPRAMTGADTIIDILKTAELLEEDDENLLVVSDGLQLDDQTGFEHLEERPTSRSKKTDTKSYQFAKWQLERAPVSIQIQIECGVEDIEALAPKIRALLRNLAEDWEQAGDPQ